MDGIEVEFVSAKEIGERIGEAFTPSSAFDNRAVGVKMTRSGKEIILIEEGAPRRNIISTIVHELTHIWQTNQGLLSKLELEQIEGHASWVEVDYMKKIGEERYSKMTHKNLLERNDEYGKGYKKLMSIMDSEVDMSPFRYYMR
jgi:hypothetical protein